MDENKIDLSHKSHTAPVLYPQCTIRKLFCIVWYGTCVLWFVNLIYCPSGGRSASRPPFLSVFVYVDHNLVYGSHTVQKHNVQLTLICMAEKYSLTTLSVLTSISYNFLGVDICVTPSDNFCHIKNLELPFSIGVVLAVFITFIWLVLIFGLDRKRNQKLGFRVRKMENKTVPY